MLYIFPLKADKKTFDANKEELGFASKPKVAKKVKTAAELEAERVQKLRDEEEQIRGKTSLLDIFLEMVGLNENSKGMDFQKINDQLVDMQKRLPSYK